MKHFYIALAFLLTAYGVNAQKETDYENKQSEHILYPVLFQQRAAEYRALCYQAFNIGKIRVAEAIRKKHFRPLAIISDLDETLLDNSPMEAELIKKQKNYTAQDWKTWSDMAKAGAVPGAQNFLAYCHQKGIHLFYISNRDTSEVNATMHNLRRLGFPDADRAHLVFRSKEPSKESRRRQVAAHYEVVLLLGDNMTDFMKIFENQPVSERNKQADRFQDAWGKKFIVLPNAIYGDWESALFGYRHLPEGEAKEKILKDYLIGY